MLALAGGAAVVRAPGLGTDGQMTDAGRRVFAGAARGLLDGVMPNEPAARARAAAGLLERVDQLVRALPPHARAELSQLLALLNQPPGRRLLAQLEDDWSTATVAQIQAALQSMRVSSVSLRQQAYHALHDITSAAYFSDASAWSVLGYPGPMKV